MFSLSGFQESFFFFFTSTLSSLPNRPGRRAIAWGESPKRKMLNMVYGKWRLYSKSVVRSQKRRKKGFVLNAIGELSGKIKSTSNLIDPWQNPKCIIMPLQFIFFSVKFASHRPVNSGSKLTFFDPAARVVHYVAFWPLWCIGIGIGIGKSLICIWIESMTSPIVIT